MNIKKFKKLKLYIKKKINNKNTKISLYLKKKCKPTKIKNKTILYQ